MRITVAMRPDVIEWLPWDAIGPHEEQAQKNHGQTLDRLLERGGLSALEAYWIIYGLGWACSDVTMPEAIEALRARGMTPNR